MEKEKSLRRSDWLLALLYSSGTATEPNEPIEGTIRIMKDLFLLQQEAEELPSLSYRFVPYLYGPCSFDVYGDLIKLKKEGLISEETIPNRRWSNYKLTATGKAEAEKVFEMISEPIKRKISEIKKKVSELEFLELLRYIYKKYPDFAVYSIIYVS